MFKNLKLLILILILCISLGGIASARWDSYESEPHVAISSNSIPAGTSTALSDCTALRVEGTIRFLEVQTRMTFNASGGSDVVVGVYTSVDNVNYDTEKLTSDTITVVAGETVQKTFFLSPDALWYKFIVDNSSSSYAITGITVTVIKKN